MGWCCCNLSSFSMCMRVVLPALSRPCRVPATGYDSLCALGAAPPARHAGPTRNRILAFLLYRPSWFKMP